MRLRACSHLVRMSAYKMGRGKNYAVSFFGGALVWNAGEREVWDGESRYRARMRMQHRQVRVTHTHTEILGVELWQLALVKSMWCLPSSHGGFGGRAAARPILNDIEVGSRSSTWFCLSTRTHPTDEFMAVGNAVLDHDRPSSVNPSAPYFRP